MFLKKDLVEKMVEEEKASTKKEAGEIIDFVFGTIKDTMEDQPVKINEFKWKQAKRASRRGRNPQTGEEIIIPEKTVLKFKLLSA